MSCFVSGDVHSRPPAAEVSAWYAPVEQVHSHSDCYPAHCCTLSVMRRNDDGRIRTLIEEKNVLELLIELIDTDCADDVWEAGVLLDAQAKKEANRNI